VSVVLVFVRLEISVVLVAVVVCEEDPVVPDVVLLEMLPDASDNLLLVVAFLTDGIPLPVTLKVMLASLPKMAWVSSKTRLASVFTKLVPCNTPMTL
jgi:hypothetical protein